MNNIGLPALIYSSQTGNTKLVAEAIHAVLPPLTPITPVQKAPPPDDYDGLILGFWVHRAKPDPLMWKYMDGVKGKTVALFGTMVARPDSDHAAKVLQSVEAKLSGNKIIGCFLCQGKLADHRFQARMNGAMVKSSHPMTPERRALLMEAKQHPDREDIKAAQHFFRQISTWFQSGAYDSPNARQADHNFSRFYP